MRPLIRPWLKLKRARWRGDRGRQERRHQLINQLAPGRSFLDAGGMWNLAGEIAFQAEEAGATAVTLLDGIDPEEQFLKQRADTNSEVRYVQGDLHEPATLQLVGEHDIVWCTGVLYHTPHPYLMVEHLRSLSREYMVLGSHVIPEVPGFPQACIFYPLLEDRARNGFASTYDSESMRLGPVQPFSFKPGWEYSNWWWAITPSAVRAMLSLAGFEIIEEHEPEPLFMDVVAKVTERPSPTPPLDYARLRGLDRLAEEGNRNR